MASQPGQQIFNLGMNGFQIEIHYQWITSMQTVEEREKALCSKYFWWIKITSLKQWVFKNAPGQRCPNPRVQWPTSSCMLSLLPLQISSPATLPLPPPPRSRHHKLLASSSACQESSHFVVFVCIVLSAQNTQPLNRLMTQSLTSLLSWTLPGME